MSDKIVTLFQVIWWLFIIVEAYRNHYIIVIDKERPNYLVSFILRGIAAILTGIILDPQLKSWEGVVIIIYLVSTFWVLFNPLLNKLRKLDFWYLGMNSGPIDRFFLKYPKLHRRVYVGTLIIAAVSLYVLYTIN